VTSGTTVDGFIWRKYGQKDINGHKHPRQVETRSQKAHSGAQLDPFRSIPVVAIHTRRPTDAS
jgi:hypothetical protein